MMKGSSMDTSGCLQQLILVKDLTAKSRPPQQELRKGLVTPGLTPVFREKCVFWPQKLLPKFINPQPFPNETSIPIGSWIS